MAIRSFFLFFSLSFILIFLSHQSPAQNCCSGGVPLSSSIGVAPEASNVFQSLLIADINYLSTFQRGTRKLEDSFRARKTTSLLWLNSYSFNERFSADMTISWVQQFRRVEGFGGNVDTETSAGIGDLVFLAKYKVYSSPKSVSSLYAGTGIKLPTGATDQRSNDGIILNLDMQPGSGSLDALFWLYFSTGISSLPSTSFFYSNLFQLTGRFDEFNRVQQYEVGNSLVSRIGATDNLLILNQLFDVVLEVIFRKNWKDKVDNQILPNTGGQWLFIKPGLTWVSSPSLRFNMGVEIPLYADVVGEQLTSNGRLVFQLIYKSGSKISL
ncbi:MAG: hypothetical protein RIM99_05705 [Cyclobacteriaceae bacterium]